MKLQAAYLALATAFASGAALAEVTISGDVTGAIKVDDRGHENKDGVYLDGTVGIAGKHELGASGSQLIWAGSVGLNNSSGSNDIEDWLDIKDAYLGVQGNYGTLRAGRMMMPSYDAQDQLYTDTGLAWLAGDYGLGQGTRVNNMLRYDSPVMAGFQASAAYAFKDFDDEGKGSGKTYDLAARYRIGGLQLDGSYQQRDGVTDDIEVGGVSSSQTFDSKTYYAGARYTFQNGFGLTGGYKHHEYNPGSQYEQGEWLAQASYRRDKHGVYLSYAHLDDVKLAGASQNDSGAQAYAARYNYHFDDHTLAFVEGRYVKNESNSALGASDNAFDYRGPAGKDASRVMVGLKTYF
ncbi:porin [Chitinilyticum litopenaei]|uniref:porin n=1 Tax=Chitinilyticum litopenaei TaxID=1121276 RepID=UPI0004200A43|nr:porin [Chitinilyticum litopenaei]